MAVFRKILVSLLVDSSIVKSRDHSSNTDTEGVFESEL